MQRCCLCLILLVAMSAWPGCSVADYREDADRAAYSIVAEAQRRTLGQTEPFSIESPADTLRRRLLIEQDLPRSGPASLGADQLPAVPDWPEGAAPPVPSEGERIEAPWRKDDPCLLTLANALAVAARNNRTYQSAKEAVFVSALDLDLEANDFRTIFSGGGVAQYSADLSGADAVRGLTGNSNVEAGQLLKNGISLTTVFAVDLVKLLSGSRDASLGLLGDATVSIPLLSGAGENIVGEPLIQAERNVAYALWDFERLKQTLAAQVASQYLAVLQQADQAKNAEENYKRLITSTRRATRLAQGGRLPQIQVDQSLQDELRARDRWVVSQESLKNRIDSLKLVLGLPVDANIELDRTELDRLAGIAHAFVGATVSPRAGAAPDGSFPAADAPVELEPIREGGGGRLELDEREAIDIAFDHRTDLRIALGRVCDAQRQVVVAADALKLGLDLTGQATLGESRGLSGANLPDSRLRLDEGVYSLGAILDLPLERTAERNAFRESYIGLERAVRDVWQLEDETKLSVRDGLRTLVQSRESYFIQVEAVKVAESRVKSTSMFLEAGQAEIRDVLEAQAALLSAQDSQTEALVRYRVTELELQRDMGVLTVDSKGNWREFTTEDTDR